MRSGGQMARAERKNKRRHLETLVPATIDHAMDARIKSTRVNTEGDIKAS
jgi:hypothetical protein